MSITQRLLSAGMSESSAASKAELLARAERVLGREGFAAFFVPGRVEMLGKHTDYAGGRSLLAAVERGICVAASPRNDLMVRVIDACSREEVAFPLDPSLEPPLGPWVNYPMTVARRVARNFPQLARGADIAFASDLPQAAGMSSSSALVVGTFLALAAVNDIEELPTYQAAIHSREELAAYLGCVENGQSFGALAGDRGVGTFGGSEDHVAMLCCEAGTLSQYAFAPVRLERTVPFPADHSLVIASSGVVAEKTGAAREAYNRAALATRTILARWREATGEHDTSLGALLAREPGNAQRLTSLLGEPALRDRLAHFVAESTNLVPCAGDALVRGDLATLGEVVDRSQREAESLLRNQVPETIHLARAARTLGAAAASAFGAGFGGSVWAMVRSEDAHRFVSEWHAAYVDAFPLHREQAVFLVTRPGPAAAALR